jgi:hypothetical protein
MTRHLFALTLALHLAAVTSWAEPCTSGSLCGQVFDPIGAGLRGANVQLTFHGDAAVRRNVRTDVNGQWVVRSLDPGEWEIVISMEGFKTHRYRSKVRCSPYRFEPKPRPIEPRIVILPSAKGDAQ